MKHISITIQNDLHFRDNFEDEKQARFVIDNLKRAIADDVSKDETAHLNLQYWVPYDDYGDAGFEVNRAIFGKKTIYVNVEFITTAK